MDVYVRDETNRLLYAVVDSRVILREQMERQVVKMHEHSRGTDVNRRFLYEGDLLAIEQLVVKDPVFYGCSTGNEVRGEQKIDGVRFARKVAGTGVTPYKVSFPDEALGTLKDGFPLHMAIPVEPWKFANEDYDPQGAAGIRSFSHS